MHGELHLSPVNASVRPTCRKDSCDVACASGPVMWHVHQARVLMVCTPRHVGTSWIVYDVGEALPVDNITQVTFDNDHTCGADSADVVTAFSVSVANESAGPFYHVVPSTAVGVDIVTEFTSLAGKEAATKGFFSARKFRYIKLEVEGSHITSFAEFSVPGVSLSTVAQSALAEDGTMGGLLNC